jgi:hypothetical protein
MRIILAAAWWHERIANSLITVIADPVYVPLRRWFGHTVAYRFVGLVQDVVYALVGGSVAWFIARDYLTAKWKAEIEAENRQWYAAQREAHGHA